MEVNISAAADVRTIPPKLRDRVAFVLPDGPPADDEHVRACHGEMARRIADVLGLAFAGVHTGTPEHDSCYLVPADTLGAARAASLGIRDELDLYGGVIPSPFVGTKTITHPLVHEDAAAPAGWSHDFARRIAQVTLRGFSVFSRDDARLAGERLLASGAVRIKPALARAGQQQSTARRMVDFERALEAIDGSVIAQGIVLEEEVNDAVTFSVGAVRLPEARLAYYGVQRLTRDNGGAPVYGGSDIVAVLGDFDAVLAAAPPPARPAIAQAAAYDRAATESFSGLIASRRNYDVVAGTAADGSPRSGVLEQSWRVGGATGAEIAALEAFRADASLRMVEASTFERYGNLTPPPADATIYYFGEDPRIGPVAKYTRTGNRWPSANA